MRHYNFSTHPRLWIKDLFGIALLLTAIAALVALLLYAWDSIRPNEQTWYMQSIFIGFVLLVASLMYALSVFAVDHGYEFGLARGRRWVAELGHSTDEIFSFLDEDQIYFVPIAAIEQLKNEIFDRNLNILVLMSAGQDECEVRFKPTALNFRVVSRSLGGSQPELAVALWEASSVMERYEQACESSPIPELFTPGASHGSA